MKLPMNCSVRMVRIGMTALGIAGAAVWAADKGDGYGAASMESPARSTLKGKTTGGQPLSHEDARFLRDAAAQDLAGIAYGSLAIEKGATDKIKDYGRKLIDNSISSTKDLLELASRKNIFIPVEQLKLPEGELSRLGQKPGTEFDAGFIVAVINNGVKTQMQLQQMLGQGHEKEVRDFAIKRLSVIGDQLSDARSIGKDIGIAASDLNPPPPVAEEPSPQSTVPPASPSPEGFIPRNEARPSASPGM